MTTGNEAAVENADVIRYLAEDDVTRVIATFSEQVKSPATLVAACEAAAAAGKPVVMLKVGRSEGARRAARAHTGSLVGADDVVCFSELCLDLVDEVAEIDVNPLLVLPEGQGVLALDGLIVPREGA